MNDHHLDPPEEPDYPECCGDEMICFPDGVCCCVKCGNRVEPYPDYGPEDYPPDDPRDIEGDYLKDQYDDREEGEVDDYDYAADDLAFDAAREKK